LDIMFPGSRYF